MSLGEQSLQTHQSGTRTNGASDMKLDDNIQNCE